MFLSTILFLSIAALSQGSEHVTFLNGTLNLVLSAPHGGFRELEGYPNRSEGCMISGKCEWSHSCGVKSSQCKAVVESDYNTRKLILLLRERLKVVTGEYPCVVINELHRRWFDANRDEDEATFKVPAAVEAFKSYHKYVDDCQARFKNGIGLFLDIHGQSHKEGYMELGYLPRAEKLNTNSYTAEETSVRALINRTGATPQQIVSGSLSLGRHFEDLGAPACPSTARSGPGDAAYFNGNFNPLRHGSKNGGKMDAIQTESPIARRRDDNIDEWSELFVEAVVRFMEQHYGVVRANVAETLLPSTLLLLLVFIARTV